MKTNFIEAHRQIIEGRWPGLFRTLQEAPTPQSVEVTSQTPEQTLFIDGIHLTSACDRLSEARLQARTLPPSTREIFLYGVALGDLQRIVLARQELERLVVVVMSPSVAFQSFCHFDHRDWLEDRRVELRLGSSSAQIEGPLLVAPAILKLCAEDTIKLRDQLCLVLAAPFQQRHFEEIDHRLTEIVRAQRGRLEADGDVASLFGSRSGGMAIVTAAGPTLDDWIDWVKEQQGQAPIIAVSTALAPLQQKGIDPDVVIIVEHHPLAIRHLEGVEMARLTETPLVYAPVVDSKILDRWPGPKLVSYLSGQTYEVPRRELPRGELFCSGTVTHAAVDLAAKMGARSIALVGVDFCYPDRYSHAKNVMNRKDLSQRKRYSTWVLNGLGERVPTETNLMGYLRDLEVYVAKHPEIEFIKCGRRGAGLDGVRWLADPEESARRRDES